MPISSLKKINLLLTSILVLSGCAPLFPSNYLNPCSVYLPERVDYHYIRPRIIPINLNMISTPEGQSLLSPKFQSYEVGAYDGLNIIVWGHPEFSTIATSPIFNSVVNTSLAQPNIFGPSEMSTRSRTTVSNSPIEVQTNGTIFYPYVGKIHIAGKSIEEIQQIIALRLSRYVRNPQVTVQVTNYRNRHIYVLGEVGSPGMQPITDKPLTLMEAINTAGNIDLANADPSHIYIIRGDFRQPDVYYFNVTSPQMVMLTTHIILQEGDIVYVSTAALSSVTRFVNQILPGITSYAVVKQIIKG